MADTSTVATTEQIGNCGCCEDCNYILQINFTAPDEEGAGNLELYAQLDDGPVVYRGNPQTTPFPEDTPPNELEWFDFGSTTNVLIQSGPLSAGIHTLRFWGNFFNAGDTRTPTITVTLTTTEGCVQFTWEGESYLGQFTGVERPDAFLTGEDGDQSGNLGGVTETFFCAPCCTYFRPERASAYILKLRGNWHPVTYSGHPTCDECGDMDGADVVLLPCDDTNCGWEGILPICIDENEAYWTGAQVEGVLFSLGANGGHSGHSSTFGAHLTMWDFTYIFPEEPYPPVYDICGYKGVASVWGFGVSPPEWGLYPHRLLSGLPFNALAIEDLEGVEAPGVVVGNEWLVENNTFGQCSSQDQTTFEQTGWIETEAVP